MGTLEKSAERLTPCPDCGAVISKRAAICPRCGGPVRTRLQPVIVHDVDISFGQMIVLLLKLALAAIPALLILFFLGLTVVALFGALR